MIYTLCGASASGKDMIQSIMINKYGINPIVSMTSRPMRVGEVDGREYIFVSDTEFKLMIKHDKLIEYREYNTANGIWYYGLPKMEFDDDKDYVVILDVNGTKDFIKCIGADKCKIFHITCPREERTKRAMNRGSFDLTEWERRLRADDEDFSIDKFDGLDYTVINNYNRDINDVVKEILNT